MFELARSAWTDYDKKALSEGAAIFERSAKTLTPTPEIKRRFQIVKNTVTPRELMKALLTARVDLLWFGGIGTYVKESGETHGDAGDHVERPFERCPAELRCEVVGEGANHGLTQRRRIEACRRRPDQYGLHR